MRSSSLFVVLLFGAAGCRGCSTSSTPADAGAPVDASSSIGPPVPRGHFDLVAHNAELWAYQRSRGNYVVVRQHDFSPVGTFHAAGDLSGTTQTAGGGVFPGVRFCADGRLAMLSSSIRLTATIWNPKDGSQTGGWPESGVLGWSDTCELVSLSSDDDSKHATIRVADKTFELDPAGDVVGVADVTADAVLVALMPQSGPIGAGRYAIIDRKTSKITKLPRLMLSDVSWTRIDSHSFAIAPTFAEGPFLVRADAELDPAAKAALAARPIPKAVFDRDPASGPDPVASGVDATKNVVALWDGKSMAWWSLSPRQRLSASSVETFQSTSGTFKIAFVPGNTTTIAATQFGDVVGTARGEKRSFNCQLAHSVCPGGSLCASGNMETVTRAVMSEDGAAVAVGGNGDVTVVDLVTGLRAMLPTQGMPRAFVDGHDRLLIDDSIWSVPEKRVVGEPPL